MPQTGKTEQDWSGLKFGFFKTVQPNSFSNFAPASCKFKNNAQERYSFVCLTALILCITQQISIQGGSAPTSKPVQIQFLHKNGTPFTYLAWNFAPLLPAVNALSFQKESMTKIGRFRNFIKPWNSSVPPMTHFPTLSQTSQVKFVTFHIPEAWKSYPFGAERPRLNHCSEYPRATMVTNFTFSIFSTLSTK